MVSSLPGMSQYLETSEGPLHIVDFGGSGSPIVMVHGLGGSTANWNLLAPKLVEYGHVVALDLPGFGLSPPRRDWELATHAGAVTDVLHSLGGAGMLVGNSLGGLLAEIVASEKRNDVTDLVLISPATPPRFPDPMIDWRTARELAISSTPGIGTAVSKRMIASLEPRDLVDQSLQRIAFRKSHVPLELIESFIEIAEIRRGYPWAGHAVPKTAASIRRLLFRRSKFVEMIREITANTLVVQGIEDPIVSPTAVEWLCSLRPDWELIQMDATGHVPQIDAPVRLWSHIEDWLETHLRTKRTA